MCTPNWTDELELKANGEKKRRKKSEVKRFRWKTMESKLTKNSKMQRTSE